MIVPVLLKAIDVGFAVAERVVAQLDRRRAAQRAWANEPAPRRRCAVCSEIAYTPRQTKCFKCGTTLPF